MELTLSRLPEGPTRPINPNVARARQLVLRFGWNSTSFQIVNPGFQRWFAGEGDAVIGYTTYARGRVVAGGPVCPNERLEKVVREFEVDARNVRETVCYFAAEDRLETTIVGHSKFLIGAQPAWDPKNWGTIVSECRSLRAQLNRSRNKGVRVSEWSRQRASADAELASCLKRWLATKGLPPLHFLIEPDTLSRLEDRRIFVAERGGAVVGFVVTSPVANRNGWLIEQFPHVPEAPNGTVELMIDTVMGALAADGYDFVTLGLAPLSRRADVTATHDPVWLRLLLAWARKHGQRFYNFDGLDAFKAKLRPDRWEPVYCVSNETSISMHTLYSIAGAFTGGHPFRVFIRGLARAIQTELRRLRRSF